MKKSILFTILVLAVSLVHAQADEKFTPKAGDEMTYHVNASGNEYDFIVKVKTLDRKETYAVVFDWEMTAPVNLNGSIKIEKEAAKKSNAFYNRFSGGETILTDATSVFASSDMLEKLVKGKTGDVIKIKVNGASAEEESYTIDEDQFAFLYKLHGETQTLITKLLRNKSNGHTIIIYPGQTHALIVSMSIGFDISLESVK